jgi:hypothetical protein
MDDAVLYGRPIKRAILVDDGFWWTTPICMDDRLLSGDFGHLYGRRICMDDAFVWTTPICMDDRLRGDFWWTTHLYGRCIRKACGINLWPSCVNRTAIDLGLGGCDKLSSNNNSHRMLSKRAKTGSSLRYSRKKYTHK